MSSFSLLSSADNGLKFALNRDDFERNLYYTILFQDKALIGNHYLIESDFLVDHLNESEGVSFFERCLQYGLIKIGYTVSPIKSLHEIERNFNERYPGFPKATDRLRPYVKGRLFDFADQVPGDLKVCEVSESDNRKVGNLYLNLLREIIQGENPPRFIYMKQADGRAMKSLWGATREWRVDLIDDAAAYAESQGMSGLPRGEIMRAFNKKYNKSSAANYNIDEITKNLTQGIKRDFRVFLTWIIQLHQLVYSKKFGGLLNFPGYDYNSNFLATSILKGRAHSLGGDLDILRFDVELPSIENLKALNIDEVIRIRNDIGAEYFFNLSRWLDCDPKFNASDLELSFLRYAKYLRGVSKSNSNERTIGSFARGSVERCVMAMPSALILEAKSVVVAMAMQELVGWGSFFIMQQFSGKSKKIDIHRNVDSFLK